MSSPTIPVFAPDGTLGDVPYERLHDAIAAGAKIGVNVTDPNGNPGVIPADRTQDAVKAGAKVVPYNISAPNQQDQPGTLRTLFNDATASFTKRAPGESIQQQVAGAVMGDRGAQAVAQQKQKDIASGNVAGMYGHLAADELPAVLGLAQVSGATGAASDAVSSGVSKLKSLLPSTERAGANFQAVKSVANGLPVDVSDPGTIALKMHELGKSGFQKPKVITDFINRVTNPDLPPLTYEEARNFYSAASSRLSPDEAMRIKPQMRFQLAQFTQALGDSIENTAGQVGKAQQYQAAMSEYRRAKQLEGAVDATKDIGIKTLKAAIPAAGAALTAKEIWDMMPHP